MLGNIMITTGKLQVTFKNDRHLHCPNVAIPFHQKTIDIFLLDQI